ncbi:hypothetical protein HUJ04_006136 [Dendroctonus ponderosae]|nr:hypothetical protein HUJ04_006136 [Dendroctonus ponderosae]
MASTTACLIALISVLASIAEYQASPCPVYKCLPNFPDYCTQSCPAGQKLGWDTQCPRCCKPCVIHCIIFDLFQAEGGACNRSEEPPVPCEWPATCLNNICTASSETTQKWLP